MYISYLILYDIGSFKTFRGSNRQTDIDFSSILYFCRENISIDKKFETHKRKHHQPYIVHALKFLLLAQHDRTLLYERNKEFNAQTGGLRDRKRAELNGSIENGILSNVLVYYQIGNRV